jgi:hypothetical protein
MNTMNLPVSLRTALEDLTADVAHARRNGDLGRLALLCYCEIRRWARLAGEERLAALSCAFITGQPASHRGEFLDRVDDVISELEAVRERAGPDEGSRSLESVRDR